MLCKLPQVYSIPRNTAFKVCSRLSLSLVIIQNAYIPSVWDFDSFPRVPVPSWFYNFEFNFASIKQKDYKMRSDCYHSLSLFFSSLWCVMLSSMFRMKSTVLCRFLCQSHSLIIRLHWFIQIIDICILHCEVRTLLSTSEAKKKKERCYVNSTQIHTCSNHNF